MSGTDKSFNNVQVSNLREALDNLSIHAPRPAANPERGEWDQARILERRAARKTLDPVTDEEVEAVKSRFPWMLSTNQVRAALEAFKEGRWPDDRP